MPLSIAGGMGPQPWCQLGGQGVDDGVEPHHGGDADERAGAGDAAATRFATGLDSVVALACSIRVGIGRAREVRPPGLVTRVIGVRFGGRDCRGDRRSGCMREERAAHRRDGTGEDLRRDSVVETALRRVEDSVVECLHECEHAYPRRGRIVLNDRQDGRRRVSAIRVSRLVAGYRTRIRHDGSIPRRRPDLQRHARTRLGRGAEA